MDAGATQIERIDRLVQLIARGYRMECAEVEETVEIIDARLAENRRLAASQRETV